MSRLRLLSAVLGGAVLASCQKPSAPLSDACAGGSTTALRSFLDRLRATPGNGDATLTMQYEVVLPAGDARQAENLAASLSGKLIRISAEADQLVATMDVGAPTAAVASAAINGSRGSKVAVTPGTFGDEMKAACGLVRHDGGTVRMISVQLAGFHLDDGRVHIPSVN